MKKIFILTACLSLLLVFNKVNAVEENNSFGIEMYKFSKPRIAKELICYGTICQIIYAH